jgi:hypothetical protein
MANDGSGLHGDWGSTRFWLAIGVTVISVIAVAILAGFIIHNSKDKADAAASAQNVLSSVLPLLGTWVGTILAYYFSKENFEAATKSVTELARQLTPQEKLRSALAKDKMIPRSQMYFKLLPADKLTLVDILRDLEQAKKGNRIPILADKGEATYILHRSIIDKFLADSARSGTSASEIAALTVADLLRNAKLETIARSFDTIKSDSTLADAMEAMNKVSDCQDVFVTQTGKKDDPVQGWITNVIIQDNAKV